jgi:hypothetical protein
MRIFARRHAWRPRLGIAIQLWKVAALAVLFAVCFARAQDRAPSNPPGPAAAIGAQLHQLALDSDACYRVRDIPLDRPDVRFFFTDGWLIFARPIGRKRIAALYTARESTDDAELLVRPSNRSERASLARAAGAPNLNEHFRAAVFLFTDGGGEELISAIEQSGAKKSAERGLLYASEAGETVRNLATSMEVRVTYDLLTDAAGRGEGLAFAAIRGNTLGNFDVVFDPTAYEQAIVGKVNNTSAGPQFDTWTSFRSRASLRAATPPPADFSLENYRIEATIQPDLHLQAVTRMTLRAGQRLAGVIELNISPRMNLTEARVDGKAVEIFRRRALRESLASGFNDNFLIGLPAPVEAGQTCEIEIRHDGEVIHKAGDGVFFVADRISWYPTRDYRFATYDLTFRLPKQYLLAAPGDPIEERVEGDWRIVHRRSTQPIRMAGFNIGSYEHVSVKRGDYEVDMYANTNAEPFLPVRKTTAAVAPASPDGPAPAARKAGAGDAPPKGAPNPAARMGAVGAEIAEEFEWMASQFGPPPLKRIAVSPIPGFFGQGFPGLIYLSTVSYLEDSARKTLLKSDSSSAEFFTSIMHAHEVAHQWWGNLVSPASYHDEWIVEALANYSALLVLERKRGPKALETVLDEYRRALLAPGLVSTVESSGPITWGIRLREESQLEVWRAIIYGKGTWIVHMLRRRMGDQAFLRMLAELRRRYELRPISTEEFRALAAEFLPAHDPDPALESFFDTWVYGTGIPLLEMTTSIRGKAPAVVLTATVRQSGVPEDFVTEAPLEIRPAGGGQPVLRWVHTSSEPAVLSVKLKTRPQKVELAPGMALLMRTK